MTVGTLFNRLINYFERPVRLDILRPWLGRASVCVLEVGCGNHAASKTKKVYPQCKYYGLDKTAKYNNDAHDFQAMEGFYEVDLDSSADSLSIVPDNSFDCIIFSHVIEHLRNGEEALCYVYHIKNSNPSRLRHGRLS
jgi:ubiquinone/menaquinone biosynthesis C-methylase UbiE